MKKKIEKEVSSIGQAHVKKGPWTAIVSFPNCIFLPSYNFGKLFLCDYDSDSGCEVSLQLFKDKKRINWVSIY